MRFAILILCTVVAISFGVVFDTPSSTPGKPEPCPLEPCRPDLPGAPGCFCGDEVPRLGGR